MQTPLLQSSPSSITLASAARCGPGPDPKGADRGGRDAPDRRAEDGGNEGVEGHDAMREKGCEKGMPPGAADAKPCSCKKSGAPPVPVRLDECAKLPPAAAPPKPGCAPDDEGNAEDVEEGEGAENGDEKEPMAKRGRGACA